MHTRTLLLAFVVLLHAGVSRAEAPDTGSPATASSRDTDTAVIDSLEGAVSEIVEEPLPAGTPGKTEDASLEDTEADEQEVVEKKPAVVSKAPPEEAQYDEPGYDLSDPDDEGPPPPSSKQRIGAARNRFVSFLKKSRIVRGLRRNAWNIIALLALAVAITLAVNLFVRQRDSKRFLTTTRLSIVDKEVRRTCNYIEKNYADAELSVDKLCDDLVTGPAFLAALFQRELGMTVEDFIMQVRMNRARITVGENPEMSVAELAALVGYADAPSLERDFLRTTGISINEYRANL